MTFEVEVPLEYTEDDRTVFRDSIDEALKAIVRDAKMDVHAARTLRDMEALGLGDHNSANWQDLKESHNG